MMKELGNWAKSVGLAGKLGLEYGVVYSKVLSEYCKVYDLEDYELASKQLMEEMNEYEENDMGKLVDKFIKTSGPVNVELTMEDKLLSCVYKEANQPISKKEACVQVKRLRRAVVLYSIGTEKLIEIRKQMNKANNEVNEYSDQVLDDVESKATQAIEITKDITADVVEATKVGLNEMKPIVKKGVQDSIPVAKKYVKSIKNSLKNRK